MAAAHSHENRQYFEDKAATYDTHPWQIHLSQTVVAELENLRPQLFPGISAPTLRLLDYACGTGLITRALRPLISSAKGIDIAPAMVARYNDAFNPASGDRLHIQGVEGDLLGDGAAAEQFAGKDWFNFDVCAVGLGFHHFHDPKEALQRLKVRLKAEGGTVLIVDFTPDGEFPTGAEKTIKTKGFSEQGMRSLMEEVGLHSFGWHTSDEKVMIGERKMMRTLFVAWGKT